MKIKAYILLPESDEDFVQIGQNPDDYISIIREIGNIKVFLKHFDSEIWFDVSNLNQFSQKANDLVEGNYLSNLSSQLRRVLGVTAQDVNDEKMSDPECTYLRFNNDFTCSDLGELLKEAAESVILDNSALTTVINLNSADSYNRDTINVIKDAHHLTDLPHLARIHLLNGELELRQFINSNILPDKFSLRNKTIFTATGKKRIKQMIYVELATGHYWYYDFYHKDNKEHFEVFNHDGTHLHEADMKGRMIPNSVDTAKNIFDIIK